MPLADVPAALSLDRGFAALRTAGAGEIVVLRIHPWDARTTTGKHWKSEAKRLRLSVILDMRCPRGTMFLCGRRNAAE